MDVAYDKELISNFWQFLPDLFDRNLRRGGMAGDHEGHRVSRRFLVRGVAALGFGGVLAACGRPETVEPDDGINDDELAAMFATASTCPMTVAATQGPYYFDADRIRSDIREDKQGQRLRLAFKVVNGGGCQPVPDAVVEIWHCDAVGLYSGAESLSGVGGAGIPSGGPPASGRPGGSDGGPSRGGTPPSGGATSSLSPSGGAGAGGGAGALVPTDDKRYLRGAQVTNINGIVTFVTIWPGWYHGRTVHVHVMVHLNDRRVLTSQVMFDDTFNARVFSAAPYNARTGRDTFNNNDTVYQESMLVNVVKDGDGYLGAIVLAVEPDTV
jgi:protocatechuate 3,4-dioxygenase beta subunit